MLTYVQHSACGTLMLPHSLYFFISLHFMPFYLSSFFHLIVFYEEIAIVRPKRN
jgi:hypothetical protein